MLSYDTPVPVNGQASPSPTNISTHRQALAASAKAIRPAPSKDSNGVTTNGDAATEGHLARKQHHIWLVTGPAGCGKSTVAMHLANSLNLPYIEGDEFHPPANIEKMSHGIPLTDADRWDWLTALRQESLRQIEAGNDGVVLTCSALKRKYRDVIRVAPYFSHNLQLHFIYLHASEELLLKRVSARTNHYMGANMVHSQFDILEPPQPDETDVISIDVSCTIEEVKQAALASVLEKMKETTDDSGSPEDYAKAA